MARRYSYDLRMKIFKAVDDGLSIVKACKIFNISRNTIYRWKHLKRETGEILKQNLMAQPKVIMQK
ncbi:transposase family protein [Orientia tsutsugamushi str. Gilliam]|uniref:IS630 family transposase n=1 Tax=Orientia tsutsugamushi str. Gilliam TaxID=1359184 RepID=A0A0F3MC52_ORITS|nr:transposase family protein [Orientia tsutsugamushi str. Gilliam]SPR02643.1 IS630 family transposase [Orientia tsutsugamushi str. Gilliam]SPR04700.1 IS630 family transposase [Orientia tsutsugamushi str. Gilliam]